MQAAGFAMSLSEVIAFERDYPGLINDIALHIWQAQIVEKQLKAES